MSMHLRSNKIDTMMDETNSDSTNWLEMIFTCLEQTRIQQEKQHLERMDNLNDIKTQQGEILNKLSLLNKTPITDTTTPKILPNPNTFEQIQVEWNKLLNARKHAYYNNLRSAGIVEIYEDFLNRDDPIIPPKFREKHFPGQTEAHTKRLKTLEISKVKIEIERLSEHANKQKEIINNVESQIKSHIYQHNNLEQRQEMIELWVKQVAKEEEISKNIWEKKRKFITDEHSKDIPHDTEDYNVRPRPNQNNYHNRTTTRNSNQPTLYRKTVQKRQPQVTNNEELGNLLLRLRNNIQPSVELSGSSHSNFRSHTHQQGQTK